MSRSIGLFGRVSASTTALRNVIAWTAGLPGNASSRRTKAAMKPGLSRSNSANACPSSVESHDSSEKSTMHKTPHAPRSRGLNCKSDSGKNMSAAEHSAVI